MLTLTNITNTVWDLERYSGKEDACTFLDAFRLDGFEMMPYGENSLGFLPKERVRGVHLGYFPCWVDFYNGNEEGVIREYGSVQSAQEYFKGEDGCAIERFFRAQLDFAESMRAEYVVFHASDVSLSESVSYRFLHSDEEVIDACVRLINRVLDEKKHSFYFLAENQWWPGLTLTNPEAARRLLNGVMYKKRGIMLDTGHLMHTNLDLASEEEAADYILKTLDAQGGIADRIYGVHLHQSLTGDFVKSMIKNPPSLSGTYPEKVGQAYEKILGIDLHAPFRGRSAKRLIERIAPKFLTHEFITESRLQHEEYLRMQINAIS
ncbi:MAG: TIM barrel protein [Clostridia bacterium]|nr:TIM barrel protein [Clostridia bacterium]